MRGVRRRDDSSRKKVQHVRGDSSATRFRELLLPRSLNVTFDELERKIANRTAHRLALRRRRDEVDPCPYQKLHRAEEGSDRVPSGLPARGSQTVERGVALFAGRRFDSSDVGSALTDPLTALCGHRGLSPPSARKRLVR